MRATTQRLAIGLAALCLALTPMSAAAQDFPLSASELELMFRSPTIGGDIVVARDVESVLVFGGTLTVEKSTVDTVAGLAGSVTVTNSTIGTMAAAAGSITLDNSTFEEVALGAGRITLAGASVTGDATLAGGEVDVAPTSAVNGDLNVYGGTLTVAGAVNGDLKAGGESVTLAGSVGGDVTVTAETLNLAPGTSIGGDLMYTLPSQITLPEGVSVGGEVHYLGGADEPDHDDEHAFSISISETFGGGLTGWFLGLITLGICGAVALALAPVVMNSAGQIIAQEPLPSLGMGLAFIFGVPVAAALVGMTLVGIPLAALMVAAYLITLGLGLFAMCMWGADRIRQITNQTDANLPLPKRIGWALLAFVIFVMAGSIPVLGAVAQLLAFVIGSGAIVLAAWARRKLAAAT